MILKRADEDGFIKATYDSSNIFASTYDTKTNDLIILFKKGTQYKYGNVSRTDYTRFEIAESQGSVFNTHIKKYKFEILPSIDPNIMEVFKSEDVLELIVNSKKDLILNISYTEFLLNNPDTSNDITIKQLELVTEKITNYIKLIN